MAEKRRRDGVLLNGRRDLGLCRFEDKVARRVSGVEVPDLPWDQRLLTPEVAARAGLVTLREFGLAAGYSGRGTAQRWAREHNDFPEPLCLVKPAPPANGVPTPGYDLLKVASWWRLAVVSGRIHKPRNKRDQPNSQPESSE